MKKIFFLIIVMTIFFSGLKVSAHSYTTDENMSGDYEYISEEELNEGKLIRASLNIIPPSDNYYINNIYYEDNIYIIVGYVIKGNRSDIYEGYPFVSYYENNALIFSKIFNMNGNGEFKDVKFIDNYIYLGGNIDEYGIVKPYLVKLDKSGSVYKTVVLECDNNTTISNIFNDFKELYLLGVTYASNIENVTLNNKYNKVFLLVLDYDFNIIRYSLQGNDKNNKIYNIIYKNYNFYVYGQTGGDGYIDVITDYQKVVYCFDIFGEYLQGSIIANIDLGFGNIVEYNRSAYFINKVNKSNRFDVYSTDFSVIKLKGSFVIDDNVNILKNVHFKMKDDVLIVAQVLNKGDRDILKITYIKEKVEDSIEIDLYEICSLKDIYFKDEMILFYGNDLKNNVYKAFASQVVFLQKKNEKIFINDIEVDGETPEIESEKFGHYVIDSKYKFNDIELYIKKKVYKPLEINLQNKETYNIGTSIEANGDMILNGEKIDNGYIFYEEGDYLIEIKGEEAEVFYVIKIEKLTEELNELSCQLIKKEFKENKKVYKDEVVYSASVHTNNISSQTVSFAFIMIMIIFGFMVGFILPVKIRRMKND